MNCHFEQARKTALGVHEHTWKMGRPDHLDHDFAKFVFTEEPSTAVEKFGFDLVKHSLFSLPFPRCYFEWTDNHGLWCQFCWVDFDGRLCLWTTMRLDQGWGCDIPVRLSLDKLADRLKAEGPISTIEHDVYQITTETTVRECVACVATLAVKGVDREIVSVPERVNAKRVSQGRRPLPSYTVIRLDVYGKRQGGGSHASPRPHWRRGHVRRLPGGETTVVRPHVVMGEPGALPTYQIKE